MRRVKSSVRLAVEELEAREMPSFGLDTSFGLGGIDLNPAGSQVKFSHIASVAELPNGSILAAGNLVNSTPAGTLDIAALFGDVAVIRLTSAGAADPTFGGGNGLDVLTASLPHAVTAMAVLPNGKILLGGIEPDSLPITDQSPANFFVMRLNADGTRDMTFGTGGETKITFGGDDLLKSLAIQADGKIVAAGTFQGVATATNSNPPASMAIARLNADGTPDDTFGVGGQMVLSPGIGDWSTAGLAIEPDGKLIVGGKFTPSVPDLISGGKSELTLYRLNTDGTPDTSFGAYGVVHTNYGFIYASATSLAQMKDGTIVIAGGSDYGQGLLAWFKPDGSLISAEQFGPYTTVTVGPSWINSIAAVPQGGVEVLGDSYDGTNYLVEYHASPGSVTSRKEVSLSAGYGQAALAVQSDGKVVVAEADPGSITGLTQSINIPTPALLSLTRFSDGGLATSPATLVEGHASHGSVAGQIILGASVRPVIGPADMGNAVITFREGSKVLGAITQTGLPIDNPSPQSITVSLTDGDHTITAEYAGSAQWAASSFTFHIHLASPTAMMALTLSDPAARAGDSITLNATVKATLDGVPTTPAGNVTFYDGTNPLGTTSFLIGSSTTASMPFTLTAGTHHFRADYTSYTASSTVEATLSTTVLPAALGTAAVNLLVQPASGSTSNLVTLTAVVQPFMFTGTPLGNVTFYEGSTSLGTAALGSNGVAAVSIFLQSGIHSLTVSYEGNAEILAGTSAVKRYTAGLNLTATTLSVPAAPVVAGQLVVLTANVRALAAGFPIGTVSFVQGSTLLGTAKVDGHGNARLTVAMGAIGEFSFTAVYSGCSTCQSSTSTVSTLTVVALPSKTPTHTTLTTSIAAPVNGQMETFAVQVTAATGSSILTGQVAFFDGDNRQVGIVALDGRGKAILNLSLSLGLHHIRAIYLGNATLLPSNSALVTQTVARAATSVSLSGSPASTQTRKSVTLTAAIHPQFTGSPIGSVTFREGGTVLGTGTVNGNGIATFKIATLPAGKHFITAIYSGSSTFIGSTSAVFEVDIG